MAEHPAKMPNAAISVTSLFMAAFLLYNTDYVSNSAAYVLSKRWKQKLLDERTKELGLYLNLIIRALLVAGKQGAPAEGLIPFNPLYFNILRILQAEGRCRPSHLADVLSVPRTTISTAITSLAKRGIIQSEKDKDDGRAVVLSLTEQGSEVIAAIVRQDLRNAAAMLSALEESEQKALLSTLAKVSKHLTDPNAGG